MVCAATSYMPVHMKLTHQIFWICHFPHAVGLTLVRLALVLFLIRTFFARVTYFRLRSTGKGVQLTDCFTSMSCFYIEQANLHSVLLPCLQHGLVGHLPICLLLPLSTTSVHLDISVSRPTALPRKEG